MTRIFRKDTLDTPICELEEHAVNPETMREFITNSEIEFGLEHKDLSLLDDEQLNEYIDFLDYLWEK